MNELGRSTLVEDLDAFRGSEYGVDWFVQLVWRPGDIPITNRAELIRFLCYGSPKLRYILRQIRDHLLSGEENKNKLLILEDVPVTPWFYELALQELHIPAATLHSGIRDPRERQKLIDEFNDPDSPLRVLIIMYNISAQGVNLDRAFSRVIVSIAAVNAALEIQGWGRVLRVSRVLVLTRTCRQTGMKLGDADRFHGLGITTPGSGNIPLPLSQFA